MLIEIPARWLLVADRVIEADDDDLIDLVRHAHLPRDRVATAAAYLECGPVRPAKDKKHWTNSYVLKHDAEAWSQAIGFCPYIAASDLVAVARAFQIQMRPHCDRCDDFLLALRPEASWEEGRRRAYAPAICRLLASLPTAPPPAPRQPRGTAARG